MGYLFESGYEIHCSKCGYIGKPAAITKPDPLNPESSIIIEMGCPNCLSAENITVKEDG